MERVWQQNSGSMLVGSSRHTQRVASMVKKGREEKRIAEMEDLGRKNVETLAAARGWCKHLQIEMTSCGLLAQMSGLPIGSHDVTCPHAERGLGGMNLPMILPEFVIQNCRGCTEHSPN